MSVLDDLVIAAPCPLSWESMVGDDRVRLCTGCSKNVYNIIDMTDKEAEHFLQENGATQCMRIFRRADGKIMTDNCPRGLREIRNKCRLVAKIAATLLASLFSLSMTARAQSQSDHVELKGDVYIPPKQSEAKSPSQAPTLMGGSPAIIPNTDLNTKKTVLLGGESCTKTELGKPKIETGTKPKPKTGAALTFSNPANMPKPADSEAYKLYLSAKENEAKGNSMLALAQYQEAISTAKAKNNTDPKFLQAVTNALNSLRAKVPGRTK
ncbi:MAG: hypothetical protein K2X81_11920 [Candidatus Obscuribacterales bacterium]|nr:hypothetical protein [Candidatus Obscuribacterales bacterium]